jgi:hypothetical protein
MAFFTDYTTLQATIADYLARSDLTEISLNLLG